MNGVFRAWLTQELKERHWSQRELARQSGLSNSLVSKTLAGKMNVSITFCYKVASALGESPEKLLRLAGLSSVPTSEDDTLQELIELVRKLPPEDRQELLKYARFRLRRMG